MYRRVRCGLKNGRETIATREEQNLHGLAHGARKMHLINNLLTQITARVCYECNWTAIKSHAKVHNIYSKLIIFNSMV